MFGTPATAAVWPWHTRATVTENVRFIMVMAYDVLDCWSQHEAPWHSRAQHGRGRTLLPGLLPVPEAGDRHVINKIIFDELVNGVFTTRSRQEYVRIIEQLAVRGCDAVALVCTEIPLLVTPDAAPLPTLDSTRLLAQPADVTSTGRVTETSGCSRTVTS